MHFHHILVINTMKYAETFKDLSFSDLLIIINNYEFTEILPKCLLA